MGMVKINGPDALPWKPAGIEKFGGATNNICEAGLMYQGALPSDYGQRLPNTPTRKPGDPRSEVKVGQDVTLDLQTLYYLRSCERIDKRTATKRRSPSALAKRAKRKARRANKEVS